MIKLGAAYSKIARPPMNLPQPTRHKKTPAAKDEGSRVRVRTGPGAWVGRAVQGVAESQEARASIWLATEPGPVPPGTCRRATALS